MALFASLEMIKAAAAAAAKILIKRLKPRTWDVLTTKTKAKRETAEDRQISACVLFFYTWLTRRREN